MNLESCKICGVRHKVAVTHCERCGSVHRGNSINKQLCDLFIEHDKKMDALTTVGLEIGGIKHYASLEDIEFYRKWRTDSTARPTYETCKICGTIHGNGTKVKQQHEIRQYKYEWEKRKWDNILEGHRKYFPCPYCHWPIDKHNAIHWCIRRIRY
ncbi:MAG TPA: hypothetical protein VMV49_17990 [Candidatus Deferrimicrobium sp.]|nr:hypothetical protein [Candidatus Deferrimicrobium sp.]